MAAPPAPGAPQVPPVAGVSLPLRGLKIAFGPWPASAQLTLVRLLRAMGAAVIGGAGVWVAYRGSFVGTPKEILAIFLLAFTTDFTLEAAIELARGTPGKGVDREAR
jgi:hypothetical protein